MSLRVLVGSMVLALTVTGCSKSVTQKTRSSSEAAPPADLQNPGSSTTTDATTTQSLNPTDAGASSVAAEHGDDAELRNGDGIISKTPALQSADAKKCDDERTLIRDKNYAQLLVSAKGVQGLKAVIDRLDPVQLDKLREDSATLSSTSATDAEKKAAVERSVRVLQQALKSAGLKTAETYASVQTSADGKQQDYLSIHAGQASLATVNLSAVDRAISEEARLNVLKATWKPVELFVQLAVYRGTLTPPVSTLLDAKGLPRQDLKVNGTQGGSLLEAIDLLDLSQECRGLTAMTIEEQLAFSRIPLGPFGVKTADGAKAPEAGGATAPEANGATAPEVIVATAPEAGGAPLILGPVVLSTPLVAPVIPAGGEAAPSPAAANPGDPAILTNKPKTGDAAAIACDKQRTAAREEALGAGGIGELVKPIDRVVLALSDAEIQALQADAATLGDTQANAVKKDAVRERSVLVLRQGFKAAGLSSPSPDFADVKTAEDDSQQTYLGIWRKGPVLASVKRQRTLAGELQLTKLNWSPTNQNYLISVHLVPMRTGLPFNFKGTPRQDLHSGKPVGGSLLEFIDMTQVTQECRGVTAMSTEEQRQFSRIPVQRFLKK